MSKKDFESAVRFVLFVIIIVLIITILIVRTIH